MLLKCGRNELEITEKDIVLYNGSGYTLLTQKVRDGWSQINPQVATGRMKKLIKDGVFIEATLTNPPYKGEEYVYYKLA